jgi:hypothetical protein
MSMPQRTGKKWPLVLILSGLAIAMAIAFLAYYLSYYLYILSTIMIYFSIIIILIAIVIVLGAFFVGKPRVVINSLKSYLDYFLLFFMFLTAFGFTFLLSDFLYMFLLYMPSLLHTSTINELLQFYPMLFAGAITLTSIMFAVTYWVVNRVENIAELTRIIQSVKASVAATYVAALFSVFAPLFIIPLSNMYLYFTSSTLYGISFSLSYPFGLTAGMIITLLILDILADTLRRELRRQ